MTQTDGELTQLEISMPPRSIHRNIVSTRKIRTSRTSRLFTSPVPPCCIAAGCSPGKENYIRRLTCRFCVPSDLYEPNLVNPLLDPLTNIKFINGSTKVAVGKELRSSILKNLRIIPRRIDDIIDANRIITKLNSKIYGSHNSRPTLPASKHLEALLSESVQ